MSETKKHEWLVVSTILEERWLMLMDLHSPTMAKVRDPSDEEWKAAFSASENPYPWTDDSRVVIDEEPVLPHGIQLPDPEDNWAQVELYRWQHGHLPGQPGTTEQPLDEVAAFLAMTDALEKGVKSHDMSQAPDPFNCVTVMRYIAKQLAKYQQANKTPEAMS